LKQRSTEERRADHIARTRALIEEQLQLKLPAAAETA
jgi:hypothetical protein